MVLIYFRFISGLDADDENRIKLKSENFTPDDVIETIGER